VHHHQVHIVNMNVMDDMNIHEDDVLQQAVHQQTLHDIVYDQWYMDEVRVHEEVMESQTEQ
jgi:hypothetical protein